MTLVALRSLLERPLRTALTAIAIVLGVAMIAGTYVLTDQIDTAFEHITEQAGYGVDAIVQPKQEFTNLSSLDVLDEALIARIEAVPGVAKASGQLMDLGSLVVNGKKVDSGFAPAMVMSVSPAPFDPLEVTEGHMPEAAGQVVVNEKLAEDEHLKEGQHVGLTTRSGTVPVTITGVVSFGGATSLGGATMVIASLDDVQRWFNREGQVSDIVVAADDGVTQAALTRRIARVMPASAHVEVKTGASNAKDNAADINDVIGGFLTPALLAFAGAAILVGAFIIFNSFSITVAQRTREFALMRAVGATRRQVLQAVCTEALVLGFLATVTGIAAGFGVARLIGALFDAAGIGLPRAGAELAPRTVVVSLLVGVTITFTAALAPARRAMRAAPVDAMRTDVTVRPDPHPRRRLVLAGLVWALGAVLLAQGLFGGGNATSRLGALGGGSVLVFVGVALLARVLVRPFASALGRPLQRLSETIGLLARENAARNTGRTAATAGALMVGLALVVFVGVFTYAMRTSITGSIDRLIRSDLIVTNGTGNPLPASLRRDIGETTGVTLASPQYFDMVGIDGKDPNHMVDMINGIEPTEWGDVYHVDWVKGDDSLLPKLIDQKTALVEEQFARTHGLHVGDAFRAMTSNGRARTFTAIGMYRDPQLLQGFLVDVRAEQAISSLRDPVSFMVKFAAAADPDRVEAAVKQAVSDQPGIDVRSNAEYRDWLDDQLGQLAMMLYALLAMCLVISLFGIANSLFLAVYERTHELGVLRAIGATAGQVRRVIRYESAITATIGGVLGTAIGVAFAYLTISALDDWSLTFRVPYGQLVLFLVLAVVVGVLGALAPARRAARVDIVRAVGGQ